MKKFKFLLVALLSASLLFSSCQQYTASVDEVPTVDRVQKLTEGSPIVGHFTGNFGDMYIYPELAVLGTSDSAASSESGDIELSIFNWSTYDYDVVKYSSSNPDNPLYVVYNLKSTADESDGIQEEELDKYSGVLLYKALVSAYGNPDVGCWYGIKFQFLDENKEIPTGDNPVYSDYVYVEAGCGGYSVPECKHLETFEEALANLYFSAETYSESYWNWSCSGGKKVTSEE